MSIEHNAGRVVAFSRRQSPRKISSAMNISVREYLNETTAEERAILARELVSAVFFFAERGESVYLDGLGLLQPLQKTRNVVHELDGACAIREERSLVLAFEKCLELTSFHRRRSAPLVEQKELARRVHPRLPIELNLRWPEQAVRRRLAGLIKHVAYETVVNGSCSQLSALGVFYALHNRQGATLQDWCAGADIFMRSSYRQGLALGGVRIFEPPVYQDAWEPLRAAFGDPVSIFSLQLREELAALGYELNDGTETPDLPVAVFESAPHTVTYCTEGLRNAAFSRGSQSGRELVFQVPVKNGEPLPQWPSRALALGWILLWSSRTGSVGWGVGVGCGLPLCERPPSRLSLVFTTAFAPLRQRARCAAGAFTYMNLLGITEAEAAVARRHSPEHLVALLEHRELDQVTKPNRPCLVSRSGLLLHESASLAEAS